MTGHLLIVPIPEWLINLDKNTFENEEFPLGNSADNTLTYMCVVRIEGSNSDATTISD
jgi:hypothetical protein